MYKLYSAPNTGGFVVEVMLRATGAPYSRVEVDFHGGGLREPEFLQMNPMGQVPVLVLEEGVTLTESAAMCIHLADRHREPPLAPAPHEAARPTYLRWLMFCAATLYPAVKRVHRGSRYTTDPKGGEGVRGAAAAELGKALEVVDAELRGTVWLAGEAPSVADYFLFMLVHWSPALDRVFDELPSLRRHSMALRRDPVIRELNDYYRIWDGA